MAHKRLEAALQASQILEDKDKTINSFNNAKDNSSFPITTKSDKTFSFPMDHWGIYCVKFNSTGNKLAVGFGNGGTLVVDTESRATVNNLSNGNQKGLAITALKYFRPDDTHLISAGASGHVNLWQLNSGMSNAEKLNVSLYEDDNEINALDMCQDGRFFATAGKDRHIRIYDANTFKLYEKILAPEASAMEDTSASSGHGKRIFALKFHPEENNLFLTAGWDDCVKLWDKRFSNGVVRSIYGSHVCGAGLDVRGNTVLTGSWVVRDALQLWDLRSGLLTKNLTFPHEELSGEYLYSAQFVSPSTVIAGGSGTNTACTINFVKNEVTEIYHAKKPVITIDTHNAGNQIALAGIEGNLQLQSSG